jgi:hypothetical protein
MAGPLCARRCAGGPPSIGCAADKLASFERPTPNYAPQYRVSVHSATPLGFRSFNAARMLQGHRGSCVMVISVLALPQVRL